jgi:hypothetical protein
MPVPGGICLCPHPRSRSWPAPAAKKPASLPRRASRCNWANNAMEGMMEFSVGRWVLGARRRRPCRRSPACHRRSRPQRDRRPQSARSPAALAGPVSRPRRPRRPLLMMASPASPGPAAPAVVRPSRPCGWRPWIPFWCAPRPLYVHGGPGARAGHHCRDPRNHHRAHPSPSGKATGPVPVQFRFRFDSEM